MLTKGNAVGFAVLALVIETLNDEEVRDLNVEPYLNGRENGFAVQFYGGYRGRKGYADRKLVFSEMRGSDAIVIYEAKSYEFNTNGNGLTDDIYYNHRTTFSYNEHLQAARHIAERLRGSDTQ